MIFDFPFLVKIYNPDNPSYTLLAVQIAQLFLCLVPGPLCWSKNAETVSEFLTCFDTAAFLQDLVLK